MNTYEFWILLVAIICATLVALSFIGRNKPRKEDPQRDRFK